MSLFSGIGAFEKALTRKHIPFEVSGYCELDKYASKAYSLIHNIPEELNIGDITKVNINDLPKNIDLVTFGFPCTDISVAGKQEGFVDIDGNTTRSGLFFEALRIIKAIKPKFYFFLFLNGWQTYTSMLQSYWQTLNSMVCWKESKNLVLNETSAFYKVGTVYYILKIAEMLFDLFI